MSSEHLPTSRLLPLRSIVPVSKRGAYCSTCCKLRLQKDMFYRVAGIRDFQWYITGIPPDTSCPLCQVLRWMFFSTPGHERMQACLAKGVNLLFQAHPRIDRLTFNFIPADPSSSVAYCSYSLVPVCEGSKARVVSHAAFDADLVRGWLTTCDKRHRCYRPPSQSESSLFEQRVIDVQDMCVVIAPSSCQYAALSYVWGGVKQLQLTTTTMELLSQKDGLMGVDVPQTIRDAILICQLLKLRYLWIDSLCIVHDSSAHTASQIACMDKIYREAYVTLFTAAGTDCTYGIPSIQARQRYPAPVDIDGVKFCVAPHSFDAIEHQVQQSPWNERACRYQPVQCRAGIELKL